MKESNLSLKINNLLTTKDFGVILWNNELKIIYYNDLVKNWHQDFNLEKGTTWLDYIRNEIKDFHYHKVQIEEVNKEINEILEKFQRNDPKKEIDVSNLIREYSDRRLRNNGSLRKIKKQNGREFVVTDIRLNEETFASLFFELKKLNFSDVKVSNLYKAIDKFPHGIDLWNGENKLLFRNEYSADLWSNLGVRFEIGIGYDEFRKAASHVIPYTNKETIMKEREKITDETSHEAFIDSPIYKSFLFTFKRMNDNGILVIYKDISELKKLQNVGNVLKEVLEQVSNPIAIWDKEEKLFFSNSKWSDLYSIGNVSPHTGMHISELVNSHQNNGLTNEVLESFEATSENYERFFRKERSYIREHNLLENGTQASIFTDVTEIDQKEKRLQKAIADLEEARSSANTANNAKSDFLANMSHELRTPLNAIIGLTEMLIEDVEDDKNHEYIEPLNRINSSSLHLLSLINDILDLSKIEAGKTEIFLEKFNLKKLIYEIAETCKSIVKKNNNKIILEIEPEISEIESDQKRIKQIIFNLVSNACKFTNNGEIYLRVFSINETCKSGIKVEIEDTGIGMNDDQLKKLFQSYSQADISISSKYGGTGLGLKISQLLARLLGGDVTVNSLVNKGTTFTVTFIPEKVY